MWNWRRDRQPCSRHWSGDRNWSCYRRLNVEVPAIIYLHLSIETTSLLSSELKCRFGAEPASDGKPPEAFMTDFMPSIRCRAKLLVGSFHGVFNKADSQRQQQGSSGESCGEPEVGAEA